MKAVPFIFSGDGGWSDWWRPPAKASIHPSQMGRIICCSCGLSHDVEFRVIDGAVWQRYRVNSRSTAAARRKR